MKLLKSLVSIALLASTAWPQQPRIACAEDANIGDPERAIDSAALKFVQFLLGDDPGAAYDAMSQEGRQTTTREQLESNGRLAGELKPKNVRVLHSYFIEVDPTNKKSDLQHSYTIPKKGESTEVICSSDLTKPDGWVSLRITDVPTQAHVLLSADAPNNKLAFTIWLVPEQAVWKIHSFWLKTATLADKGPLELWQEARAEDSRGHKLNANLLYAAAAQLTDRGPNFQLGIVQYISEDIAHFVKPPGIQGEPPFLWKDGSASWKVRNVGLIAVGGKIYVVISHEVSPWKTDDRVIAWNKALLVYFKRRFPEYSEVFAGLVASAYEQGTSRGYRTVDELPSPPGR